MTDDDESSHYASLLFLDQNHNSLPYHNDVSSDVNTSSTGRRNWTPSAFSRQSGEMLEKYQHQRRKYQLQGEKLVCPDGVADSYARPGNHDVSHTDREGNWGSSKNVPARQHPLHYTMAWIKEQNT